MLYNVKYNYKPSITQQVYYLCRIEWLLSCCLSFFATVGPIFGMADSFDSDVFVTFPMFVRPASYKARARILPMPSSVTSDDRSSFIPYFIRILSLYSDPSKSSRLITLQTSYNE